MEKTVGVECQSGGETVKNRTQEGHGGWNTLKEYKEM